MLIQKIIKARGEYAKKGVDIKDGDVVTIQDQGQWIEGQYGQQCVVKVETNSGPKNANFNQTSINILHDEFGGDTSKWIGKSVTIRVKKDTVAGKKVDIYYFVTPNWVFDEYRELVNSKEQEPEIPVIEVEEPTDLPF